MKIFITLMLVILVIGAEALPGQNAAPSPTNPTPPAEHKPLLLEKKVLSLEAARKMADAAINEAEKNHWRGVVAVADDGGWLILLERMDNAFMTASVELAAGKARSAALFKKPTQQLEDSINHGRYAAITAAGFMEMQGGLPVVVDGQVVGAIGASFATPAQDVQVAQAGLAALNQ
jgi:glc operon protein GlcG